MEADRQYQMQQEAELRRYAEENQRLRSQRAVDEAVNERSPNSRPGAAASRASRCSNQLGPLGRDLPQLLCNHLPACLLLMRSMTPSVRQRHPRPTFNLRGRWQMFLLDPGAPALRTPR